MRNQMVLACSVIMSERGNKKARTERNQAGLVV